MKFKKTIALLLCLASVAGMTACGKKDSGLNYPDRGYATADKDSWEQIEEGDGDVTVYWYVDSSSYSNPASLETKVGNYVYKKTGIKIEWMKPLDETGSMLSTMIAGNNLPDVISVGAGSEERFNLPLQGYVYPIDDLAEKYAPTLLNRIDKDIRSCFVQKDGKIYGLPNQFYTTDDMNAYKQQEGSTIISNGALVARKDWLEEYISYKKSQDSSWTDKQATTPEGFTEMCKWVKDEKGINNDAPTLLLSPFRGTASSTAMRWIMQYFCVPREDSNGNLVRENTDEKYQEALWFLNNLYREKIIYSGNFSVTSSATGGLISNGTPFAFLGSPQDYEAQFKSAATKGVEYVPIVLTNSDGDVPQFTSLAGKGGWRFSMITNNCKRPDRVIKLFDFLMSDEGQSLFFGIENEEYEYEVRPGEVKDGKTYKYGKIKWTEKTWKDIQNSQTASYGFFYFNPLVNPMYPRLAGPNGEILNTYSNYVLYNLKAALTDYVYVADAFAYVRDANDPDYQEMTDINSNISNVYAMQIPKIISAKTEQEAKNIYDAMIKQADNLGAKKLYEFDNATFKKFKESLGITWGFPPNDPNSCYKDLQVTSLFGNLAYNKTIPDDIVRK